MATFNLPLGNEQVFNAQGGWAGRPFVLKAIEKSLFAFLTSNAEFLSLAAGGVHRGISPVSAQYPLCQFHFYSSKVADWSFAELIRHPVVYVVKAISSEIAEQTDDEANEIAAMLGEMMKDSPLTFPDSPSWGLLKCRLQQPITYDEGLAGQQFFHRGFQVAIDVTPI
jgi:hypothetical protein